MLGTGTFFQDSDEGVPDTSLLLLAAARLREHAKEVAEEQQYIRGKPKLRPRTPPTRPRSTSPRSREAELLYPLQPPRAWSPSRHPEPLEKEPRVIEEKPLVPVDPSFGRSLRRAAAKMPPSRSLEFVPLRSRGGGGSGGDGSGAPLRRSLGRLAMGPRGAEDAPRPRCGRYR